MVHIQALKNLNTALQVAVKVGQTASSVTCISLIKYDDILGQDSPILRKHKKRIQIIYFPTSKLESILSQIKKFCKDQNQVQLFVSEDDIKRNKYLINENVNIISYNIEGDTITKRCNFFLANIRDEAYILNNAVDSMIEYLPPTHNFYPHIYVSFSNKTTFLKVNSPQYFEYLGESDLEVITFFNQAKSSLHSNNLIDIIRLAKLFLEHEKSEGNLESEINNSLSHEKNRAEAAYTLIKMFLNNLGHLSTLYAKLHNFNQIFFDEIISEDIFIKKIISESVKNHSNNNVKAIFFRHERFLQGIDGFVLDSSAGIFYNSWTENYSESSGLAAQTCLFHGLNTVQLTLDSLDNLVTFCPLLVNPIEYFPDTQNLSENSLAREYWINCIVQGVSRGIEKMAINTKNEALKNLYMYKDLTLNRLAYLKTNHQAYGNLSMRLLQDTLENLKREMGLITQFEKKKQNENAIALKVLDDRLKYLDSLSHLELQKELVKSFLAGNMFDWGANEVAKLMSSGKFDFHEAMDKIPERPWLIDDLDEWTKRFTEHSYKSVMIFADNSGYDFIIGVLPFARALIRKNAKVVISVNSEPVLNDVTSYELKEVFEELKNICPILKKAIEEETLTFMEMAKSSCCLDLSFIDVEISKRMEDVDLLVIEGMGRAVHTNLFAKFKCDTLLVAVIKDHWLSKQFGGDKFASICKFTYGIKQNIHI